MNTLQFTCLMAWWHHNCRTVCHEILLTDAIISAVWGNRGRPLPEVRLIAPVVQPQSGAIILWVTVQTVKMWKTRNCTGSLSNIHTAEMTSNWPMLKTYSHHSRDVTFTRRTLLTMTETQICAGESGDDKLGSSKLTKFSYWGTHLSRAVRPHAITLPVSPLQRYTPHITNVIVTTSMPGSADVGKQVPPE